MKKAIHVKIPKPCHEDWAIMTPTQKGKHCASCEKEVTDFTQKSDEQIVKMLTLNPNSCGRFKKTQLNREIKMERKSTASLAPYAAGLLLPLSLLGSLNTKALSKEIKTEKVFKSLGIGKFSNISESSKAVTLTVGIVTDTYGNAIKDVKITSSETGVVAFTNNKGEYKIICNHGETLRFEKTNFVSFEFITKGPKLRKNITLTKIEAPVNTIRMGKFKVPPKETLEDMGEMIIIEEINKAEAEKVKDTFTKKAIGEKYIFGTVTDSSGLPLPGVNIVVKGTTNGTQSDFDGRYKISVNIMQVLVFSYVGFDNVQKTITASSNEINVTMDEGITGDIVVLSGYYVTESTKSIKPFGNTTFADDPEREAINSKQKQAYENGLKFKRRKWKEKKEARKLKREQLKAKRTKKKIEKENRGN